MSRLYETEQRRVLSRAVIGDVEASAAGSHTQQESLLSILFEGFIKADLFLRLGCLALCAISFIILIRYLSVVI